MGADETRTRSALPFAGTFVAAALLYIATNSASALYPLYQGIYGLRPFTITTIYAVYVGTLIPTLIFTGSLAHVIGLRAVLATAWFLGAGGAAVFASAQEPVLLYAARLLQGASVGLATGALAAALVALDREHDPRRASVGSTLAISVGSGLGPIIGGVFVDFLPMPDRLVFIVLSVLLALCGFGFLLLPRRLGVTGIHWQPRLPRIPAENRTPFLRACANAFLVWAVTAIFLALVPSYFHEATGNTSIILSSATAGLMLISAGVAQLSLQRVDSLGAQRWGLVVVCLGLGLLVIGGILGSAVLILLSPVIAGAGQGVAFLGGTREVNAMSATRPDHASVFAAFAVSAYCGSGIPIIGVGLLGNLVGTTDAVLAFAVAIVVLSVLWLVVARRDLTSARGPAST